MRVAFAVLVAPLYALAVSASGLGSSGDAALIVERSEENCAICLESISAPADSGQAPTLLRNCEHADRFHSTCLQQWTNTQNSCPMCRVPARDRPRPITSIADWYSGAEHALRAQLLPAYDRAAQELRSTHGHIWSWNLVKLKEYLRRSRVLVDALHDYTSKLASFFNERSLQLDSMRAFETHYFPSSSDGYGHSRALVVWNAIMDLRQLCFVYNNYMTVAFAEMNHATLFIDEQEKGGQSRLEGLIANRRLAARLRVAIIKRLLPAGHEVERHAKRLIGMLLAAEAVNR